ncbi:hypothetical protein EGT74_13875 [Chitinophaga lutea]|uniref:Uncharacterized protein n=1 Tax=Chitinophaga lutea TaxID=2488634 RepID=A0A3N4PHH0_9BACT|nr:hypothetical protein [Chitinophaga lutea]RPE08152.1 hypothetical protein EGT74_13875 [Chitinophaga lutea]
MKKLPRFKTLRLADPQKRNLPVFFNFVSYVEHPKKTIKAFHYNQEHQYYVNYFDSQKLLSKIIRYDEK